RRCAEGCRHTCAASSSCRARSDRAPASSVRRLPGQGAPPGGTTMADPISLQRPDRRRPEPLWHQAEMSLRQLIERGEWAAGSQIPNEDRLCEMLGISRITVRHALRNLEEAGLLRREHGRGTFVRSATVVAGVRGLTSFTDEMKTLALAPSTQLLEARRVLADEELADALEIALGDPVVQLKRLR